MFPYEYTMLLKTFKELEIPYVNVYLEASSVSDTTLNNSIHRVKYYYNKRFYKYTEEGFHCVHDLESQLNVSPDTVEGTKTLFGSEGSMLPSKTELIYAQKGSFDLYTITNVSFMDLALSRKIRLNVFAVTKENLADRHSPVQQFSKLEVFTTGELSIKPKMQPNNPPKEEFTFEVNATFDLKHEKENIYDVAAKLKEVVGHVDNLAVLERQSFEVLINDMRDDYTIEKIVRLNLTDYHNGKHVFIVKIVKDTKSMLVISDTLTYQSHVPFQTLLLPMRVCILGAESKNFISCPHVWTL